MELVEREELLGRLTDLLETARKSRGRLALVGGEAGSGKTSLVRTFIEHLDSNVRVLWGTCDPLSTPRPLAPFHDMERLAAVIRPKRKRHDVLRTILDELSPRTVMVVEDAHWADGATLDALRFVGRRVESSSGLLIVTYRDDEIEADHPFRTTLGDLATATGCERLKVPRLTEAGVARLVGEQAIEPGHLHQITGGNPFFVTEILATPGATLPDTVSDAVLARVGRLSPQTRDLLELVSTAPGGLESDVMLEVIPYGGSALDEAAERGVLIRDGNLITFRHELARLAVEESVSTASKLRLHLRLLDIFEGRPAISVARLSHHAYAAGDGERVLRYAQAAAREASARGAHREAASQYAKAIEHAQHLSSSKLGDLLSAWADEAHNFEDPLRVADVRAQVVELHRRASNRLGEGVALVKFARALSFSGRYAEAELMAGAASRLLEEIGESPDLALAHAQHAYILEMDYRAEEAVTRASRAIELASRINAPRALSLALQVKGEVDVIFHENLDGVDELSESHTLALALGDDHNAALALLNLGASLMVVRRYREALVSLEQALTFARERDLDRWAAEAMAWIGRIHLETGSWKEAEELANTAMNDKIFPGGNSALYVNGRVLARRGLEEGRRSLARAWETARALGFLGVQCEAITGYVEAAWLAGSEEELARLVPVAREILDRVRVPWVASELAFRLWRAGELAEPPGSIIGPFALHMSGDWEGAAREWKRIGCPYEQAEALADGDESAMRQALRIFSELGAEAAGDRLRAAMRSSGIRGVPSRPRTSTRDAPGQLTRRQLEVLALIEAGLSNSEIADHLFISEKTASHHVSAILGKLNVRSRAEAGSIARKLDPPPSSK
ncbi:MAG TPA: AAA family ATPase [Acidimicrobiia bacterium]|nr:AAA family ATPase [Acidimicrobiia bacterium]